MDYCEPPEDHLPPEDELDVIDEIRTDIWCAEQDEIMHKKIDDGINKMAVWHACIAVENEQRGAKYDDMDDYFVKEDVAIWEVPDSISKIL